MEAPPAAAAAPASRLPLVFAVVYVCALALAVGLGVGLGVTPAAPLPSRPSLPPAPVGAQAPVGGVCGGKACPRPKPPRGIDRKDDCAVGQILTTSGINKCVDCPAETYQPLLPVPRAYNQGGCIACPAGWSTFGAVGQASCGMCPAGTYSYSSLILDPHISDKTTHIPSPSYIARVEEYPSSSCIPCPADSYSGAVALPYVYNEPRCATFPNDYKEDTNCIPGECNTCRPTEKMKLCCTYAVSAPNPCTACPAGTTTHNKVGATSIEWCT